MGPYTLQFLAFLFVKEENKRKGPMIVQWMMHCESNTKASPV